MSSPYDVVKSMLRTEKASLFLPENKYLFWVDRKANKIQIKSAVEEIYKVKVEAVNTLMQRGKLRRVRYVQGKSPDWKKALVTLKEGSKIEVT
ncbi:MAG: 50S ribosomal protein L23 [Candidatus Omnitrophica bacterium]|nr:50S ribosomal protein L23 [Candidatus Omnitrophota bacterium]